MPFNMTLPDALWIKNGLILQTVLRGKMGWVTFAFVVLGLFWVGLRRYTLNKRDA